MENKQNYPDNIRQIGFILNDEILRKLKALKAYHRCRNQSALLCKIIDEEYKRITT